MGKIAVLWGQIDEAFNAILRWVLRLEPEVFESLLGNQMIGSRLNHLKAAAPHAKRAKVRELLHQAAEMLTNILPDRNAAMHGCWGRYVLDPTFTNLRVGTYNHQKPKTRFYNDQLPSLYARMGDLLKVLAELGLHAVEVDPEPTPLQGNKMYFAPQPPDGRAEGVWFERGDRVVPAETRSQGWRQQ